MFAPDPASSDVGRLIGDRYLLGERIGVGGMATVHRAYDRRLDLSVAVKLLRREVIADTDIAMRFRREALAATVLRHPNIVACLEAGSDDGQPYLVMELVDGEDLAARLTRVGRLGPAEAVRIGLEIARGLGVAHIRGIVHRDVKPGNILLARDGRAMVTDFGIARLAADAEGAVPGTTLGSVHYFSPEQANGETTTTASDVYGLGLVLYEALTGQRAWSGETTEQLAMARIDAPAPSPRAARPELSAAMDALVVRALDPDPALRYPDGNAMAAALEALIAPPDPTSPTGRFDTREHRVSEGDGRGGSAATVPPSRLYPRRPGLALSTVWLSLAAVRGPLVVLLSVVVVAAGAFSIASLAGGNGPGGIAVVSARPQASVTDSPQPTASPSPTAVPTASPSPTVQPTPTPDPTPKQNDDGTLALCEPILDLPCGLGAGTYAPTSFTPPVRFALDDGWSTFRSSPDLFVIGRDEGLMTFAGGITTVNPRGDLRDAPQSAGSLIDAFIGTDHVVAGRTTRTRIGERRATVVDLQVDGPDRVALFGTGSQTFHLEPIGTTRVIAIDLPDGVLVIAIEPRGQWRLDDILGPAGRVLDSLGTR